MLRERQRLVTTSPEHFRDLTAIGLRDQRQNESRATFRNLALIAGASEFHVDLITHPKPERASDDHTRLEMQWPAICDAVLRIDPSAWDGKTIVETRATAAEPGGAAILTVPPHRPPTTSPMSFIASAWPSQSRSRSSWR